MYNSYKEVILLYVSKKYTRLELCDKYNLSFTYLSQAICRRKINLWDRKTLSKDETDEICKIYKRRKMTRDQIVQNYRVSSANLLMIFKKYGIAIWDRKDGKMIKKNKAKKKNIYFSWDDLKNHPMISFNK